MLEDGEKGEDWEDEPCQEKRGRNWRRVHLPASAEKPSEQQEKGGPAAKRCLREKKTDKQEQATKLYCAESPSTPGHRVVVGSAKGARFSSPLDENVGESGPLCLLLLLLSLSLSLLLFLSRRPTTVCRQTLALKPSFFFSADKL